MEFNTKESYEQCINATNYTVPVTDYEYTKPDKHYIYPQYSVFEKELSKNDKVEKSIYDMFSRVVCSAILAQNDGKPVEILNGEERLGVYIGAGIPMKYENGKMITLYDVGVVSINGKYKVLFKTPNLNNTY